MCIRPQATQQANISHIPVHKYQLITERLSSLRVHLQAPLKHIGFYAPAPLQHIFTRSQSCCNLPLLRCILLFLRPLPNNRFQSQRF